MAESTKRKFGDIRMDRISMLPREIQEIILCFLQLRDAVRTSILSKHWRHCWTTIPLLIFDHQFFKHMIIRSPHSYEVDTNKFVSAINGVLLLHNGPILKFFLGLYDFQCAQLVRDRINQWSFLLSRNGIKQLTLENDTCCQINADDFSFLNLTHLRLAEVQFPYTPAYVELTYLRSLELKHVVKSGQSIFNCPVLEKLMLMRCTDLSPTDFKAPNLKCIHEESYQITFTGLENLREYSFRLMDYSKSSRSTSIPVKILGNLHKIEKFTIGLYFIKYLAEGVYPGRLPKPMPCLKSLTIYRVNFTKVSEISCLLYLMRSAPNLCKLNITARFKKDPLEVNLKDCLVEDCTMDHLEIVRFDFLNCLRSELELLKFILARSPLLKTMFITAEIKKDVAVLIEEEILQYPKVSSKAQIRVLVDYGF